jgi:transposase
MKIKKQIIEESQLDNYQKDTRIYTHILDEAIHQLCSNIKSAISNLKNGNIKKFRIKYWKLTRPSMTMTVEQSYIKNNQLLFNRLGTINYYYGNQKIKIANEDELKLSNKELLEINKLKIEKSVKINYNSILKEYYLIIPKEVKKIENNLEKNKFISLDPGLRTFLTGVSNNSYVEIQNDINKIISNKIEKLDSIKNNKNIPNKIKKKNEIIINRKINNYVNELHWKTINFLIKNYKTIFLGDMSAKDIVRRNKTILSKIQKRSVLKTKYYLFSERLKYKCDLNSIYFKLTDESYTSKLCSNCGTYNNKLKGCKIFICKSCDLIIDRDLNGARNIYFKNLM